MTSVPLSRRDFLSAALLLPALARQSANERFVSLMSLGSPGGAASPPFGRLLGDGLDARLFTDLSTLGRESALLTTADKFFVRTAAPSNLPPADSWALRIGGRVSSPYDMHLRELEPHVSPARRVLIECSGNADQTNYGLMSAADWEGIPLPDILDRARPSAGASRVLISGVDDDSRTWRTSLAGASWIFTRDQLAPAMLAVRMNGAPLTRDHGFPVRLIVPGWYGCSCIKWVNRIELVPDDTPATTQMQEFAARTHQPFDPRDVERSLRAATAHASGSAAAPDSLRAADFLPATIDTAAMPVRVEKWFAGGRVEYRVTGIIWGGSTPTNALSIRFKSNEPWMRVDQCAMPASTLTWSLWSHTWRPAAAGRYQIVLRVDDPRIRTRRLDIFFYVREIQIDDV
jgi:DMSO/TMAO reductase YedYZ molybdopterin-dependent catalytic subunit